MGSREYSLLMLDLDHIKAINDLHGHDVGDAVLVEVGVRLRRVGADRVQLARMGGDEFVCVLSHEPGIEPPARLATQITRAMAEPIVIGGRRLSISVTIGIARAPCDADEADGLLRAADVAMHEAKALGRGRFRFFDAAMSGRLRDRAELESALRKAIDDEVIEAWFQPVWALNRDRVVGFEALARWRHPDRGVIPPDSFIPIAEDLGLIDQVTLQILRQGCRAARDWPSDVALSINISPIQLRDPWLGARLLGILSEYGLPPSRLIVEVTENAVIEDLCLAREVFKSLQNAGIRISLDDFGKGYSSLTHLRELRFDSIKIDGSFVQSIESPESREIVNAVTCLGRALGMPVTAEGVETDAAAAALREIGCENAQGYLLGRPMTAFATLDVLAQQSQAGAAPLRKTA